MRGTSLGLLRARRFVLSSRVDTDESESTLELLDDDTDGSLEVGLERYWGVDLGGVDSSYVSSSPLLLVLLAFERVLGLERDLSLDIILSSSSSSSSISRYTARPLPFRAAGAGRASWCCG